VEHAEHGVEAYQVGPQPIGLQFQLANLEDDIAAFRDQRPHCELTERIYVDPRKRLRGEPGHCRCGDAGQGLDPETDRVTRTDFVRRVTLQLNDMYRKGKVEKIGSGRGMRWRLV
jgi:hypothetical protein